MKMLGLAHLLRPAIPPPAAVDDAVQRAAQPAQEIVDAALARATDQQRPVILREAFREPQARRRIGAREVERLQLGRAQPLDVPAVDELVAQRIELRVIRLGQPPRLGDDRRVAMLHPIARDLRHIVGDEGIGAVIVARRTAEQSIMLRDHPLRLGGIGVDLRLRPHVMHRQPDQIRLAGRVGHRPLAQRKGAELGRAVHEILKVRRPIRPLRFARGQLRRDAPFGVEGVEAHADRLGVIAGRPQEGRRHVEMRVGSIDLRVGSVTPVAEQRVGDDHGAVMARHRPAIRISPRQRERPPVPILRRHRIDVLREFVDRISPRRRTRHLHAQRPRRHAAERRGHLRLVMHRIGKGHVIRHRRGLARIARLLHRQRLRRELVGRLRPGRGHRRPCHRQRACPQYRCRHHRPHTQPFPIR
ncbi:hypothetical protein WR25_21319 [Diploscapter pachys]|uniref:Uncharacterized protein n=1 Tax=Diploscapter pachys TaxID=2018661 RepID=A0A2A2M348_9BILA|nr:hypothetical protein WR25_21319 [Diploscapter pachys]